MIQGTLSEACGQTPHLHESLICDADDLGQILERDLTVFYLFYHAQTSWPATGTDGS